MEDAVINNVGDLKAEIARLRQVKEEQGNALALRFNSPLTALATLYTVFPNKQEDGSKNDIFHQDFFGLISRIILPFALNKTLFRNSNFLVKGLIGFLSQKASHFINEESIKSLWDSVRSFFDK